MDSTPAEASLVLFACENKLLRAENDRLRRENDRLTRLIRELAAAIPSPYSAFVLPDPNAPLAKGLRP